MQFILLAILQSILFYFGQSTFASLAEETESSAIDFTYEIENRRGLFDHKN